MLLMCVVTNGNFWEVVSTMEKKSWMIFIWRFWKSLQTAIWIFLF